MVGISGLSHSRSLSDLGRIGSRNVSQTYCKRPAHPLVSPLLFVSTLCGTKFLMKTFSAKAHEVERDWYIVDADGKTLGRMATEIARRLRGKHKPEFTPHVDTGDYIVVINAEKVRVTGNKLADKMYYRHTGYIGNLKEQNLETLMAEHPERAIEYAVKGMLPKNPLGRAVYRKLKVYAGSQHPHEAQQPKVLDL
jgi:large subunit ribosomal protein L13